MREQTVRPVVEFESLLTKREKKILDSLTTPAKIQYFLDSIPYSTESIYRCPLRVLRERVAHCFDGALFAAAALRRIGYPPLIMNLIPNQRDDDHVLALFKKDGHWGAIAKSNFTGLRFREPIFRTLREQALSYFEQYYNTAREKTLRGYTLPLNLKSFDQLGWMYKDHPLELIAQKLDTLKHFPLLNRKMIAGLQPVDLRSHRAGLLGADKQGLFKPY
jgi:hypothetical protein